MGRPAEPWLSRRDWSAGRVENAARAGITKAWLLLGVGTVTVAPLLAFVTLQVARHGRYGYLLWLVWPVVALVLCLKLLRLSRTGVFARLTLRLPAVPIWLGQPTMVELEAPAGGMTSKPVLVIVRCTAASAKDEDKERILWEESWEVAPPTGTDHTSVLPIELTIPRGCSPTVSEGRVRVVWQLFVRLRANDGDRIGSFDLPVYG